MPYIEQERRDKLDKGLMMVDSVLYGLGDEAGDLNYVIYVLMLRQFMRVKRYSTANRLYGVLSCVGLEFYRRYIAGYENSIAGRNGDIKSPGA
jgi:hypothetical protein